MQDVLQSYSLVFGALLDLRIMAWQLQQCWQDIVQQHGDPPELCPTSCISNMNSYAKWYPYTLVFSQGVAFPAVMMGLCGSGCCSFAPSGQLPHRWSTPRCHTCTRSCVAGPWQPSWPTSR